MLNAMNTNLLYEQESYQIIGACFEVYREKGCGFLEPVYRECMEIEPAPAGRTIHSKEASGP